MEPKERFEKYRRLAYFAIRKVWPEQSRQRSAANRIGMDYEDFDQIALCELWRCCLNFEGDSEKGFREYAIKSIRFSLIDELRRRSSLIKYSDSEKQRAEILSFDAPAPAEKSNRGGTVDLNSLIDGGGQSVEAQVIRKLTLEDRLSVLNQDERLIISCKIASYTQKDLEKMGYSIDRQNYFIRKAYQKLGIVRNRSARKDLFIALWNAGKSQEDIMKTMHIDKFSFRSYRKTYRDQLKPAT